MFMKMQKEVFMNIQDCTILKNLLDKSNQTQRSIALSTDYSLGTVNRSVNHLIDQGYINDKLQLSEKAYNELKENQPQRAVILAAGFGMRMVPINTEVPKGLLQVGNETLIERLIKQLHEAGIVEIDVVVGFLKEQFEFLIDQYHVNLIYNPDYSTKNNLYSLNLVKDHLENCYIIPCDIWCDINPFSKNEFVSWYMVNDQKDRNSPVRVNRKEELVDVGNDEAGNHMIGIAYVNHKDAQELRKNIAKLCENAKNDNLFWEDALYEDGKYILYSRVVHESDVIEINTYEQLRELDHHSNHLKSDAMNIICDSLHVSNQEITDIKVLKKGMTNRSFLFTCNEQKYIMRIPGEGTDQLIDRKQEAEVYQVIHDKDICDDIVYINPENGYKITKYLENARVCDPLNEEDTYKCMRRLKAFHSMNLQVHHDFDIYKQIAFYESLWDGTPSVYRDYQMTKTNVMKLRNFVEKHIEKRCLTHIDAVPDNFLFVEDGSVRLIDWEYAGMQDPHVDIAMFCIYALYDRQHVDMLIDQYFDGNCLKETRIKIYCYIALCGLLWSNWCEYKRNLGVEFGEYSLKQYRYAKDYYRIVEKELGENL